MSFPALARARLVPVALPLVRPLRTAHGAIDTRRGLVLELESRDGHTGAADCLPLPGFGLERIERAEGALERALERLVRATPADLDAAIDAAHAGAEREPAARATLDVALHDLAARAAGRSLAELLATDARPLPAIEIAALVAGDAAPAAAEEARRQVAAGFRTLKLKVTGEGFDRDLARARAVRSAVGPGVALRFDANGAFDAKPASCALAALAELRPEFVEEPMAGASPAALAALRASSPVRIAADETLRGCASARALRTAGAADVWVLKPATVGGLRAAAAIAAMARLAALPVVVTSFLDSALGLAAGLQLAASLGADAPAAGLATDALLAEDVGELPAPQGAQRALPTGPGLGVSLSRARLDALACGPVRELRFPC